MTAVVCQCLSNFMNQATTQLQAIRARVSNPTQEGPVSCRFWLKQTFLENSRHSQDLGQLVHMCLIRVGTLQNHPRTAKRHKQFVTLRTRLLANHQSLEQNCPILLTKGQCLADFASNKLEVSVLSEDLGQLVYVCLIRVVAKLWNIVALQEQVLTGLHCNSGFQSEGCKVGSASHQKKRQK